jgi:hypothetical protein
MFHIYLIMKVGNFIYYNIKELVAIRLISIRNWSYLHTFDDNFLFGFFKNRTLNHKFPTECGRWQNMCTEHGLTRSGLEPTIYRYRGEHANGYTTDESLWWVFLVCFLANTYIVQWRIQDYKLGGAHLKNFFGVLRVKNHAFTPKNHIFSNFRGAHRAPPPDPPLLST